MGQEVKNPLRAQSKYGLMGSSAKTGKKFFGSHRSTFCIKMPFGIGHPPPTHQMQSTCVQNGSRVPNLQTEFNYLDSFKSYGIFSDFVVPVVPTLSPLSPHHPCCPHVIPKAPRRSPCGPHGCGLCGLHPMLSLWSPSHPHVVPIIPTLSRRLPHHPQPPRYPLHPPPPPWGVGALNQ